MRFMRTDRMILSVVTSHFIENDIIITVPSLAQVHGDSTMEAV
jgi:hypothetical protein